MSQESVNVGSYEKQQEILDILKELRDEYTDKNKLKRYTVKIDKNNSDPYDRITYLHDAKGMIPVHMDFNTGKFNYGDWKDIWFIRGNYPVMLKSNGTVDYRLNPDNYTKKMDGSASDVANLSYDGNAMARFPKVYLSFTEDENYEYISVCESKYNENYEPIGFINDSGNEVDEIFLSIYEGYNYNSKQRSLSGQTPTEARISDHISRSQANGTGWYISTWAQRQMVNALLTIISKSDNSQEAFGYGYCATDYSKINTGTLNDKGQFFGYNGDTPRAVKVFHMENWWGNMIENTAGIVAYQGKVYAKMSGPYNINGSTSTTGYTEVLTYSSSLGNTYGANCKCNNTCGRLPISNKSPNGTVASTSTFLCDRFYIKYSESDFYYCVVCGYYGLSIGASCVEFYTIYGSSGINFGAIMSYMK